MMKMMWFTLCSDPAGVGDAVGVGVGVGVGSVLAPSPWQPVSTVRDSTAKTAANAIFFSWVIRPCMDKLSATAEAQSDTKKQELWSQNVRCHPSGQKLDAAGFT